MSEISTLIKMQEIDLELLRLRKKLSEIPERNSLAAITKKADEVMTKSKQISELRSNCEVEVQKLVDEDQVLARRADELEKKIQESSDFRIIENLTRDLEGIAKRRNKVEFDLDKLAERSDKISAVEDQIASAQQKFEEQQQQIEQSINEQESQLKEQAQKLVNEFNQISKNLPAEMLEKYNNMKETKGGIALGVLQGAHCSTCRVEFPEGKLKALLSGPQITTCPQCHRILIVEKD